MFEKEATQQYQINLEREGKTVSWCFFFPWFIPKMPVFPHFLPSFSSFSPLFPAAKGWRQVPYRDF
jgi:hypothetical protein